MLEHQQAEPSMMFSVAMLSPTTATELTKSRSALSFQALAAACEPTTAAAALAGTNKSTAAAAGGPVTSGGVKKRARFEQQGKRGSIVSETRITLVI